MTNETVPDGQRMGFEEWLQLLETLRAMTKVMEELIHKPAVNYNNYGTIQNFVCGDYHTYAPINNSTALESYARHQAEKESRVPTFDDMMKLFLRAKEKGLWNSMRCWGIGFQMYQIWGYKGTPQDFTRTVNKRPDAKSFAYPCNTNAIYKMMSKGHLSLRLENWRKDGVLNCYCLLGEMINNELLKLYPLKKDKNEEIEG